MSVPPVSVIIPTLNEERYLPVLLESLAKVSAPLDVVVVDGNSTDGTRAVVEKFQPSFSGESSLTLVALDTRGISLQRNAGAARAKHPVLMFCDADVVFSDGVYRTATEAFSKGGYVVAAPALVPLEPGVRIRLVYGSLLLLQKVFFMFGRPYFAGSCLLTTKEVFDKVGGFDVEVLLGEDVDYSVKAARLGSSGLLSVPVQVSARRILKYGYWWMFKEIPNVFRFFVTGRVDAERMFYPFGDFTDTKR